MTQENDPLLKERYIDYERDATGKADGKKEIGFGHTYSPDKKFFIAVTKDGKEYKIPVKRKVPGGATKTYLTFQESKDVARKDAMIHRDSARKTIKNFDELPEELKMVATDIDLNVKGKFNTFSKFSTVGCLFPASQVHTVISLTPVLLETCLCDICFFSRSSLNS